MYKWVTSFEHLVKPSFVWLTLLQKNLSWIGWILSRKKTFTDPQIIYNLIPIYQALSFHNHKKLPELWHTCELINFIKALKYPAMINETLCFTRRSFTLHIILPTCRVWLLAKRWPLISDTLAAKTSVMPILEAWHCRCQPCHPHGVTFGASGGSGKAVTRWRSVLRCLVPLPLTLFSRS